MSFNSYLTMSKPSGQKPVEDDALNPKVDGSTLDFLLIELVPTIQRITEQALAREQKAISEAKRSKIFNGSNASAEPSGEKDGADGVPTEGAAMTSLGFPVVTEQTRDGMNARLDNMGYRVGQGLAER